jgi:predicted solute-binding protein|tara:strand:+ start:313 stop:537 length:225 start_codon:yes stop_codon:yes gene_type:complete
MYQPVKGKDNWFRDSQSGSFNCADEDTYKKYMMSHAANKKREVDFKTLQNEVSELKSDMSEIKSLLLTLVQKSD